MAILRAEKSTLVLENSLTVTELVRPAKELTKPITPPLVIAEKHLGLVDGNFRTLVQGNIDNVPEFTLSVEVTKDSTTITGDLSKLQVGNTVKVLEVVLGVVTEIAIDKRSAVLSNPVTLETGTVSATIVPGKKVFDLISYDVVITPREQLLVLEIRATFSNGEVKTIVSNLDIDKLYTEHQIERV